MLEIFDVANGRTDPPVHLNGGYLSDHQEVGDPSQGMKWSPNSQYLALDMLSTGNPYILVYTIRTKSIFDATISDNGWHEGIAWANDSNKFVTASESCVQNYNNERCPERLAMNTFSVTGQMLKSIDATNLYTGDFFPGFSIRAMQWSPDDRYISFQSTCQTQSFAPAQGIYLWDQSENQIKEVTHIANFGPPNDVGQWAEYNTLWINADYMLVSVLETGVSYTVIPDYRQAKTFFYQPDSNRQTPISSQYLDRVALNPITHQLAYTFVEIDPIGINIAPRGSVQLATIRQDSSGNLTLQNNSVALTTPLSNGCDLFWSPDGRFLAYTSVTDLTFPEYAVSPCFFNNTSIDIMDNQTVHVQRYAFANDKRVEGRAFAALGWTVVPTVPVWIPTVTPIPPTPDPNQASG